MYNEFDPKHYKGKWPCTTKTLYNEKTLIGRLHQYFLIYFETFSVPTADTLFLLILSILTLESAHSIRFLYQHFLSGITEKSLNVFYYACSYAKVDYSRFMNTTVRITLKLIPDSLQTQPVFLCVDDTMVSKFGTKFENVSKLFDHAAHNGSNYLNGHCFVSVMLCVPVWNRDKVSYLSVPPGYRLWQKKEPGIHRWWISESGSDWQCKDWFCHVWSCTCTDRSSGTSCQTWKTSFCWNRFYVFQWKDWWLLYRCPPGSIKL